MKIPYDQDKLSYTKSLPSTPHPFVNLVPNPNILISDELLSFSSYFFILFFNHSLQFTLILQTQVP